jgi:hypothetical protein
MRAKQSFWGMLGGQLPGAAMADVLVVRIRSAMYDALDAHCEIYHWQFESRIGAAEDVSGLWQLRTDLMHLLSTERGESFATEVIHNIDSLFGAVKPLQSQRRSAPRRISAAPPNEHHPSQGLFSGLRRMVGVAGRRSTDVENTQVMERQEEPNTVIQAHDYAQIAQPVLQASRMELVEALSAHQQWNARLAARVAGTSSEKFDGNVVRRDDQCVLGHWIAGPGEAIFGAMPVFAELRKVHAEFHRNAAGIVRLLEEGKVETARNKLRQGEYLQSFVKVQKLISALYSGGSR